MGVSFAQRGDCGSLPGEAKPALGAFLTFCSRSSGPAEAGQRNASGRKPSSGSPQQSPGFFLRRCQKYVLRLWPITQVQMLHAPDPAHPCWPHPSMGVVGMPLTQSLSLTGTSPERSVPLPPGDLSVPRQLKPSSSQTEFSF